IVPAGATAMSVTVYGASAPVGGAQGASVTGSAAVAPTGLVQPGSSLSVRIDAIGTTLTPDRPGLPWMFAPVAGGTGTFVDRLVFPTAQLADTGGLGPGRAVVTFTVPAATIGDLATAVDFGVGPVGRPATRNLPITVGAEAPLGLTAVGVDGPFTIDTKSSTCVTGPNTNVPAGSACTFAIVFTPTERGPATGTLTLTGNIAGGNRAIALTGTGSTKPGAPTSLSATAGQGRAVLTWMPPADTGASPVTGYRIRRASDGAAADAPSLTTLGAESLTYTDESLENDTTYTYVVIAINVVGESDPSTPADATPAAALVLPAAALPAGVVGRPYNATLTAQGGTAPYHWITDEPLPDGLTLDPATGTLSGTPSAPGQTRFTATVSDSAQAKHESKASFVITVAAPPPPPAEPVKAALTPDAANSDGGPDVSMWLWGMLGLVGLIGVVVAVRRLRARRV
ncbi:putative Ig domain-containing protein, partial [Streptomyces sp. SID3343]|uniref:putative Ig domain-containing protein n=1 Tax=Streptomyces sp. SID3343 TaxID=2690260 RepID=UPI00136F3330